MEKAGFDYVLVNAAERALAALETPKDLTKLEIQYVIDDLNLALLPYRA